MANLSLPVQYYKLQQQMQEACVCDIPINIATSSYVTVSYNYVVTMAALINMQMLRKILSYVCCMKQGHRRCRIIVPDN